MIFVGTVGTTGPKRSPGHCVILNFYFEKSKKEKKRDNPAKPAGPQIIHRFNKQQKIEMMKQVRGQNSIKNDDAKFLKQKGNFRPSSQHQSRALFSCHQKMLKPQRRDPLSCLPLYYAE